MAATSTGGPVSGSAPDSHSFFGHPRGLSTLFFTEFWERFSYYGMRALLLLFMTAPVDKGGLGIDVATGGAIYGLYTAMVYMVGLPGGWLADRFLGLRNAVLYGGIIIALGHVALALHGMTFFYLGLGLVIAGTALLKPTVSSLVGGLYAEGDPRRDAGFSIYYMGINLGAGLAPLVCGYLAQSEGFKATLVGWGMDPNSAWHWGFGAAAVGMACGVVQFALGTKHLGTVGLLDTSRSAEDRAGDRRTLSLGGIGLALAVGLLSAGHLSGILPFSVDLLNKLVGASLLLMPIAFFGSLVLSKEYTPQERNRMLVLAVLFMFSALFWSAFEQAGSSLNLFADRFTDNSLFGYAFPSSWFQSVNAGMIIVLSPVFGALWTVLGSREPSSAMKFVLGLLLVGAGFMVVAVAAGLAVDGAKAGPMWLVMVYLLHTMGELCVSPVGLSLVTKLAPIRAVGQLMGIWFLATAMGNFIGGQVAAQFEKFPLPQLFTAVGGTTIVAGLLLLFLVPLIKRLSSGVK